MPSSLSCDYGLAIFDPGAGPTLITLVGALAAIVLLCALAGVFSNPALWRHLAILAAVFCASYALISNTLLLIGVSLAERLMYWPSVAVLVGVSTLLVDGWRRLCAPGRPLAQRAALLRVFGMLLLVVLCTRSVTRNADWTSDERLFRADIATHPNGVHLCNSLARIDIAHAHHRLRTAAQLTTPEDQAQAGLLQAEAARYLDEAEALLKRALSIRSHFPEALRQLGAICWMRGDVNRATAYLEAALRMSPSDRSAQQYLAELRGDRDKLQQRAAALRQRLQENPEQLDAYVELSNVLIELGKPQEALILCEQGIQRFPDRPAMLRARAETLALNQLEAEALAAYQRVLAREPDDWQTLTNVSTLLAQRDPAAALQHAEKAYRLHPNDVRTQVNLAEVLVLNGRTGAAIERLRAIENALAADDPFRQVISGRRRELEDR